MRKITDWTVPKSANQIAQSLIQSQKRSKTFIWEERTAALSHKNHLSDEVFLNSVKTKVKNFNVITWNINAGLNILSTKNEQIRQYIETINPHIFMGSEVLGMKFGYKIQSIEKYAEIRNMKLLSYDKFGVTAIYSRSEIKNIIPVFIDSDELFPDSDPINRIHASAAIMYQQNTQTITS